MWEGRFGEHEREVRMKGEARGFLDDERKEEIRSKAPCGFIDTAESDSNVSLTLLSFI